MDDFTLTCLGVGDGTVDAERNKSAYFYQFGDTSFLVDCGEPVSRTFRAAGFGAEAADRILLSHLHSDHIGGLFMLLQGFWLEKRKKPLTIQMPEDGIDPIRRVLTVANLVEDILPYKLSFEAWKPGQTVEQGAARVTAYPTTHLDSLRARLQRKYPGQYAAFCFLFEAGGRRIGHSADLGSPRDLEPLLNQSLDLLVCELAHFTIGEVCAFLRERSVRKLVFTHLARQYWEDFDNTRRQVTQMLPHTTVLFARDGDTVPF